MSNIDRVSISQSLNPSSSVSAAQRSDQVRGGQNVQYLSSAKNDSVGLSSTSKDIERISGLVGQSREERIERVRQMLDAGTYNVSSEDLAKKLIESNWK